MKFTYIAFLLAFTAACSSNKAEENPDNLAEQQAGDALHIHFLSGFYQDTITLYHGREKIYESVLTTAEDKKLTDKFIMPKAEIRDTLYFRVAQEGRVLKGYIPTNADPYVGFYLTSGTAVNIYSKDTPFMYN